MESNYRIEDVQVVNYNGKDFKLFAAYRYDKGAFVYIGRLSAPWDTPHEDLWRVAEEVAP